MMMMEENTPQCTIHFAVASQQPETQSHYKSPIVKGSWKVNFSGGVGALITRLYKKNTKMTARFGYFDWLF